MGTAVLVAVVVIVAAIVIVQTYDIHRGQWDE